MLGRQLPELLPVQSRQLLYFRCDAVIPSPTFTKANDGAEQDDRLAEMPPNI